MSGRVSSPNSASIAGLRVQIVDRNVGQDVPLAETVTDIHGRYRVSFVARTAPKEKAQLDLQARVLSREAVVGASDVRYDATAEETLNIVLPAGTAALATEHEALIGAVSRSFKGPLHELQETRERADITYLANKTGWDARAVALAALADQFSQIRGRDREADGIPSPLYYALFRAGLPANADALYQFDRHTVQRVWKEALAQGVIPKKLEEEIPRATAAFADLSADKLLVAAAPDAVSSLQELLEVAQVSRSSNSSLPPSMSKIGQT